MVNIRAVRDINIFHRQGIKDFSGGRPPYGVRQVVVTDEKEYRDATGGQTIKALGKLSLLGLARLTALVGITAEEDEVYPVLQGVVNHLVKNGEEIKQARGYPGSRVNTPLAFDTEVKVGKVEDFHII